MGLNIVLNIVFTLFFIRTGFAQPLAGLALATSVSSVVNFFLLRIALKRKIGALVQSSTTAWLSMIPAGIVSFVLLLVASPWVASTASASTFRGILAILGVSAAAIALFLGVFAIAGGKGARSIFSMAFRRGRIRKS